MQVGMVGLGRMGSNLVRRLRGSGHDCVVFDTDPDAVAAPADAGVDRSGARLGIREWTAVLPTTALTAGQPQRVEIDGVGAWRRSSHCSGRPAAPRSDRRRSVTTACPRERAASTEPHITVISGRAHRLTSASTPHPKTHGRAAGHRFPRS